MMFRIMAPLDKGSFIRKDFMTGSVVSLHCRIMGGGGSNEDWD
jgi:hypothetical protein